MPDMFFLHFFSFKLGACTGWMNAKVLQPVRPKKLLLVAAGEKVGTWGHNIFVKICISILQQVKGGDIALNQKPISELRSVTCRA